MFLREANAILNGKVDIETRAAMLEKWVYVFKGMGMTGVEFRAEEATPERIIEVAERILRWIADYIRATRV